MWSLGRKLASSLPQIVNSKTRFYKLTMSQIKKYTLFKLEVKILSKVEKTEEKFMHGNLYTIDKKHVLVGFYTFFNRGCRQNVYIRTD